MDSFDDDELPINSMERLAIYTDLEYNAIVV